MKRITILGETLDIRFNMAVELAYEQITDRPFRLDELDKQRNIIALSMAAIFVANPDTGITVERMLNEANGREIADIENAVIDTMTDWLAIPKVVTDAESAEPQEDVKDVEEQSKN